MSRKKKESIRQDLLKRNVIDKHLLIMDRIISKRYIAYKKAHLERKRRYRLKQISKKAPFNDDVFSSFRCGYCHNLTLTIHRFWGFILCVECFYNPICIISIVKDTKHTVIQNDPSVALVYFEMEEELIQTKEKKKKENELEMFMDYLTSEKTSLEASLLSVYRHCPRFFKSELRD